MRATQNQPYHYKESGLNVTLVGITVDVCPSCGVQSATVPAIMKLHNLLAEMLATKRTALEPNEFRFLRTHLGMSKEDFANVICGTKDEIVAIEAGEAPISRLLEVSIRSLALAMEPQHNYEVKDVFMDISRERKPFAPRLEKKANWEQAVSAAE